MSYTFSAWWKALQGVSGPPGLGVSGHMFSLPHPSFNIRAKHFRQKQKSSYLKITAPALYITIAGKLQNCPKAPTTTSHCFSPTLTLNYALSITWKIPNQCRVRMPWWQHSWNVGKGWVGDCRALARDPSAVATDSLPTGHWSATLQRRNVRPSTNFQDEARWQRRSCEFWRAGIDTRIIPGRLD
jgi:hypothetical protein